MRKMHQIIRVENHIQTPLTPVVKTLEKHNERLGINRAMENNEQ